MRMFCPSAKWAHASTSQAATGLSADSIPSATTLLPHSHPLALLASNVCLSRRFAVYVCVCAERPRSFRGGRQATPRANHSQEEGEGEGAERHTHTLQPNEMHKQRQRTTLVEGRAHVSDPCHSSSVRWGSMGGAYLTSRRVCCPCRADCVRLHTIIILLVSGKRRLR
jgi:hypothetical protein